MIIFAIFFLLVVAYLIWQKWELTRYSITYVDRESNKITSDLQMAVLSDFHCHTYGRDNERLLAGIRRLKPDLILIPGDMIVTAHKDDYPIAYQFFKELVKIAPVYFSNGNHESRVEIPEATNYIAYQQYKQKVVELGVHILNNRQEDVVVKGQKLGIYGLEIPLDCYHKGEIHPLEKDYVTKVFDGVDERIINILLAHNPMFLEEYDSLGADYILSGHNHGGLIRIPHMGSLISPQFQWFPKYDAGIFEMKNSTGIVSRGLGTHTFHIRIFNRAELICLRLHAGQNTNSSVLE